MKFGVPITFKVDVVLYGDVVHITDGVAVMLKKLTVVGKTFCITIQLLVQPKALVPITVYEVVIVGDTATVDEKLDGSHV